VCVCVRARVRACLEGRRPSGGRGFFSCQGRLARACVPPFPEGRGASSWHWGHDWAVIRILTPSVSTKRGRSLVDRNLGSYFPDLVDAAWGRAVWVVLSESVKLLSGILTRAAELYDPVLL
jgi:hypothetical protein